jgi:hypothetical protein
VGDNSEVGVEPVIVAGRTVLDNHAEVAAEPCDTAEILPDLGPRAVERGSDRPAFFRRQPRDHSAVLADAVDRDSRSIHAKRSPTMASLFSQSAWALAGSTA